MTATAVGILGGTFNPPHVGHLVMAQEAREQLGLDRVVLMPARVPPHKDVGALDPGPEARLALCRRAAAGEPGVEVSDLELRRPGPSFTVDTLRLLHDRDPEHELTFILGGDMAATLPTWREPEALLSLARLAVAERSGVRREALAERLSGLAGPERIAFFDMPRLDISSSDLRDRVSAGRPIRHLVPDAVAEEIATQRYYRARQGSPVG